jgi:Matrixin
VLLRAPRIACFIVLISLLALGPAESVLAYTVTGGQWPQPGGMGTPVTVTYSYQNLLDGGLHGPGAPDANGIYHPDGPSLSADLIRQSVQAALSLWAAVVPINFIEVPDQGGPAIEGADYPDGQFGEIRMRHVFINGTDPPPGPGQTPTDVAIAKAQTYFLGGAGNLPGDIEFDDSDPWQLHGTIQVPDIFGAATHELGHALGLNHSTDPTAVMFPVFQRFNGPGTGQLGADDIAGIQSIYGAGHGSVTPLAVPEPWSVAMAAMGVTMLALRRCFRR